MDDKNPPWSKFQNDFDAMTDAEIADVTKDEQSKLDEAEEWLEAVTQWEAAGRPRTKTDDQEDDPHASCEKCQEDHPEGVLDDGLCPSCVDEEDE